METFEADINEILNDCGDTSDEDKFSIGEEFLSLINRKWDELIINLITKLPKDKNSGENESFHKGYLCCRTEVKDALENKLKENKKNDL